MDADFVWGVVRKLWIDLDDSMYFAKDALGMRDASSLLKELRCIEGAISEIRDELQRIS